MANGSSVTVTEPSPSPPAGEPDGEADEPDGAADDDALAAVDAPAPADAVALAGTETELEGDGLDETVDGAGVPAEPPQAPRRIAARTVAAGRVSVDGTPAA